MELTTKIIADALLMCSSMLAYPREITPDVVNTWLFLMFDDKVTGEQFAEAVEHHVRTSSTYPAPADILGIIRKSNEFRKSLPFADPGEPHFEQATLPIPPTDPQDLPVTPEFRKARLELMIRRFEETDAGLGRSPDPRARAGLIAAMNAVGKGHEPEPVTADARSGS
jgi:hypothetical protein